MVVTNVNTFGNGNTIWNVAPSNGNGTLYLQSGSLPSGQILINSNTSTTNGAVYNQLGSFTIVSDSTTFNTSGVTYAAGNAILAVANSTATGNSGNAGRTMTVSGGSNVNGGTAGLSFTNFQIDVQTVFSPGVNSYTAPVTFNIVNPAGGGVTLLSIGTLNLGESVGVQSSPPYGAGHGSLILTGNGNFAVTTSIADTAGNAPTTPVTLGVAGGTAYSGTANFSTAAISYAGSTTINSGTLIIGTSPTSSPFVVNTNNGLLFNTGFTTATLPSLSGSGNVALNDLAGREST